MAAKGVIVEFDFVALDGARLLFQTTKRFLEKLDGIPFDKRIEAKYFAGKTYLDALTAYFAVVKTKKTVAKAARDIAAAFVAALEAEAAKPLPPSFRNFVKAMTDKGVRVVMATRIDLTKAAHLFEPLLSDDLYVRRETSLTYGFGTGDFWRQSCAANKLALRSTVVVTGSGFGVKSALFAGLPVVAVANDHVSYQDFSGASDVVREVNGPAAKKVLGAA